MSRGRRVKWLVAAAFLAAWSVGDPDSVAFALTISGKTFQGGINSTARACKAIRHDAQWREREAELDAISFSERIKRHLDRRHATSKQQFRKHQTLIERLRRAYRRTRQFEAARKHVAKHTPGHRRFGLKHGVRGKLTNGSHVRNWRVLWHHGARNGEPQPAD